MILGASVCKERSMTVMGEEKNSDRAIVEFGGIASTEADYIESMPVECKYLIIYDSLMGSMLTLMTNMFHNTLAQYLEVMDNLSAGRCSRSEGFELVKLEPYCSLEELIAYKAESEKLDKPLL